MQTHLILYVDDQERSARFYTRLLGRPPQLNVPGMTEFRLDAGVVLGLMPAAGIVRLLGDALADPRAATGIARAELYLVTPEAVRLHARALQSGARELSAMQPRDWGHRVGYVADPDGHVLAFAEAGDDDGDGG